MAAVGSGVGASGGAVSSGTEPKLVSASGARAAASEDSSATAASPRAGSCMSTIVRCAVKGSPSGSGAADIGAIGAGFEGAADSGIMRSGRDSERDVAGGRDARGTSGSERSGASSTLAGGRPMALRRGTSSTGTRSGRGRLVICSSVWRVGFRQTHIGVEPTHHVPCGGRSAERRRKDVRDRSLGKNA